MVEESTLTWEAILEPRMKPGGDFLTALQGLGLDPDALFWAVDAKDGAVILVLVTSHFDYAGPLEVSRALFKAYNAAATPKEIDPFIVRLHSPRQSIYKSIKNILKPAMNMVDGTSVAIGEDQIFVFGGLQVPISGVLKRPKRLSASSSLDHGRKWARFISNVDRLAA